MSIALVLLGCILLFTTPMAVLLSLCMGVCGYLWLISCKCSLQLCLSCIDEKTPSSASAANDMTALTIVDTLSTAPLFLRSSVLLAMKKCPLAWLLALGLLKYDASLWTARTMSLALNVSMALQWVAA